ncbi:MAG TPA: hypothetical protein DEP66_03305 [Acidimicrobiaceae bacterium]|nr:hypothetical protein [Acidimicrobiaceae bacterium]
MEWIIVNAPTVEQARLDAVGRLGVEADEVQFEVLAEPRAGGFLRRRRSSARVRARLVPRGAPPRLDREGRRRPERSRRRGDRRSEGGRRRGGGRAGDKPNGAKTAGGKAAVAQGAGGRQPRSRARGGGRSGSRRDAIAASIDDEDLSETGSPEPGSPAPDGTQPAAPPSRIRRIDAGGAGSASDAAGGGGSASDAAADPAAPPSRTRRIT